MTYHPPTVYTEPMSNAPMIISIRSAPRRNTQVVDALRSGIRQRSKSWSKSGRFASVQDERRAVKAELRKGGW